MPRKDRKPAGHIYQTPDKPQTSAPYLEMVLGNLSTSEVLSSDLLKKLGLWDGRRRTFKPQALALDINEPGHHAVMLLQESRKVRAYLRDHPGAAEVVYSTMGVEHRHTQIVNGPHIAAAFNRAAGKRRQKAEAPTIRMAAEVAAYREAQRMKGREKVWVQFDRLCGERKIGPKPHGCKSANALARRKMAWKNAGALK
ncbi:MAG: hypothetical protein H2172_15750 [Opitutus sp.]|nr:hypothetical protein [Opitutus sp.]MCS6246759.1 hypothetical protein [Opitutus sp.]MCS6273279.1 hypothetical protein [Opitutus sp.]MCS6276183.1 hypothetical protein [Opitutus sp.]MCS6301277.1 hypothetical protein [Opitutus sp.]